MNNLEKAIGTCFKEIESQLLKSGNEAPFGFYKETIALFLSIREEKYL